MADFVKRSWIVWGVVALVVVLVVIALFVIAPARRPRPTINGAPATSNLTGGPTNTADPSVSGNGTSP